MPWVRLQCVCSCADCGRRCRAPEQTRALLRIRTPEGEALQERAPLTECAALLGNITHTLERLDPRGCVR